VRRQSLTKLVLGTNRKYTVTARYRCRTNPKHLVGSRHLRADARWRRSHVTYVSATIQDLSRVAGRIKTPTVGLLQIARLSAKWTISAIESRKNHLTFQSVLRSVYYPPIGLAARIFRPAESVSACLGLTAAGFLMLRADKV